MSFNADVADAMPWRFVPAQRSVKVNFLLCCHACMLSQMWHHECYRLPHDVLHPAVSWAFCLCTHLSCADWSKGARHCTMIALLMYFQMEHLDSSSVK